MVKTVLFNTLLNIFTLILSFVLTEVVSLYRTMTCVETLPETFTRRETTDSADQ